MDLINTFIVTVFLILIFVATVSAQQPADNNIKAAIYEIDRAEKQIAGAAANQASKLKRIARMIESAESQLQSSPNKSDPSWTSAQERLNALKSQMEVLTKPQPANPAVANQLSATDLNLLGAIDRQTDGFIRQLNEYKPADYQRLQENLFRRVNDLKRQYRGLANPAHPQAIVVAQKVLAVEKQINDQLASAAAQEKALGDVTAEKQAEVTTEKQTNDQGTAQEDALGDVTTKVAKIRERMHPSNRSWFGSPVPTAPLTEEKIKAFTEEMTTWKTNAQQDLSYLESIEGKTTKVNVRDLKQQVERELTSIDRYNQEMSNRIEQHLAGTDQISTYVDKIPAYRAEDEIAKLQYSLHLLNLGAEFDKAVGHQPKPTAEREQLYTKAIATIKTNAEAAKVAEAVKAKTTARTNTKKSSAAPKKLTPQRIELYGSTLIEVTAEGEVWINGDKAGDITADGEIWVSGNKEGDITKDGEVWKAGNKVGDITSKGEVWREGNQIGNVESDGTIWINSSREGWFKGGNPAYAAAIIFYGFFNL